MTPPGTIVCVIPDLFFSVKVEDLARRHSLTVVYPRDQASFESALADACLVLIDSGTTELPWTDWVAATKADLDAPSVPILAFGSHVDTTLREKAITAGVDRYMARSTFVEGLPEIVARAARDITDDPCSEPLPEGVLHGIEEFNAGEYFEQHETLERVWRAETRPVRDLYRGILQIGLAFFQLERRNVDGAIKMFERAFRWLQPFRPACQGIDIDRLLADAHTVYDEVKRLGPDHVGEMDPSAFPRIHLSNEVDRLSA